MCSIAVYLQRKHDLTWLDLTSQLREYLIAVKIHVKILYHVCDKGFFLHLICCFVYRNFVNTFLSEEFCLQICRKEH